MAQMTSDDKRLALELYKAHYTASEATAFFLVSYGTIRNLWRGFDASDIQKYDRLSLITNSELKEILAYASRQESNCR